jgi:hypothetical protein
MFTFDDAGDQPRLVMSVASDPGEENVIYVFEPNE